jgi:hypothetical protein
MGEREEVNVDKLIAIEWDMMTDLRLMLNDPKLEPGARLYKQTIPNTIAAKHKRKNEERGNSPFYFRVV